MVHVVLRFPESRDSVSGDTHPVVDDFSDNHALFSMFTSSRLVNDSLYCLGQLCDLFEWIYLVIKSIDQSYNVYAPLEFASKIS